MTMDYNISLDVFEGPLDLLLHLVKKHELNVLDIPIAFITEKYLAYLGDLRQLDIDVAGEYLVMAATLCHVKSRELLPGGPGDDDEELSLEGGEAEEEIDTRADLIRRLLAYQKYKDAANALGERPVVGRNVWNRGSSLEDALPDGVDPEAVAPLLPFPVQKLLEAFDRVMRSAKVNVTHDVLIDRLSVSQRISELTDRLLEERSFSFSSMFRFLQDGVMVSAAAVRHEAVVTFLALLEMAKLRLITLMQPEEQGEIVISRAADDIRERVADTVAGSDEYR